MAASRLGLYEALKARLDRKTATMLVDAIPDTTLLATRDDLQPLRDDIQELKLAIERLAGEFRAEIKGSEGRILRWMIGAFIPVWLSMLGMIVTLVVLVLRV